MIVLLGVALASALDADETPRGLGFGVDLGFPTGVTAAYRPGDAWWFAAGVGVAVPARSLALHADALYTLVDRPREDSPDLHVPLWVGLGPRLRLGGTEGRNGGLVAVQAPIGVGLWHGGVPWEGYVEVSPGLAVLPDLRGVCDVVVGVRYYPAALHDSIVPFLTPPDGAAGGEPLSPP